jgi:hypothetical protein
MSENAISNRGRHPRTRRTPPERGDEAALFVEHQRFLLRVTARRLGGLEDLAEKEPPVNLAASRGGEPAQARSSSDRA